MPFPSAVSTFSLGSSSSSSGGPPGGPSLYVFLLEGELSLHYDALRKDLKVSSVGQLKYVEEDDLSHLGMSRPEQRRLRKYFHNKHKIPADSIVINKELAVGELDVVQQGVWTNEDGDTI
ncbi:hypothetical protein HPB49_007886 [Dermacentor silvarum]|uniref:Uncharacterized protein n=1 Tax=Dermacentor silvarum TaxID=543639 RepID=A0ACB8DXG1_DERSI|nr:hypothetical protein HPB49_007886 [Dermacentor silvarum]